MVNVSWIPFSVRWCLFGRISDSLFCVVVSRLYVRVFGLDSIWVTYLPLPSGPPLPKKFRTLSFWWASGIGVSMLLPSPHPPPPDHHTITHKFLDFGPAFQNWSLWVTPLPNSPPPTTTAEKFLDFVILSWASGNWMNQRIQVRTTAQAADDLFETQVQFICRFNRTMWPLWALLRSYWPGSCVSVKERLAICFCNKRNKRNFI